MRAPLLSSFALLGLASAAAAADLPRRAPAPVPLPIFTWTGFYGGLFAGYGSVDNRNTPLCVTPAGVLNGPGCPVIARQRPRTDDFVAGSEIGYNYQLSPGSGVVVGAAADFQFTRLRGYANQDGPFAAVGGGTYGVSTNFHAGQRLDYLGTVRGKLGYAFGQLLVYGTGGLAYGNVRLDSNTDFGFGALAFDARKGDLRTGYVAGGGLEYAFSPRLSAKVEGLYFDLGQRSILGSEVNGFSPFRFGARVPTEGVLARAGINYRFGEGLPFVGMFSEIINPTPYAPAALGTWSFENGLRYFYSSGTHRYTLGDPFTPGQRNSRLTYRGFDAHAGESFARLDHNPTGLFLQGYFGSGSVVSGRLNDEDFPPAIFPYSNTVSRIRDGDISYATVDVGYSFLRGETYKLGGILGFQYYSELANGRGCTQVAGNPFVCAPGQVPAGVKGLTEDAHWHALRIGLAGEVRFDRLKVALEGAYLPLVDLNGFDRHWLRPDINPLPQRGSGDGYYVQGVVSYDVTPLLSVGVGGRYWHMEASPGRTQFPHGTPPSPTKFETERFGGFLQASYKISDLGF